MHQFPLVVKCVEVSLDTEQPPGKPEETVDRKPRDNIALLLFPGPPRHRSTFTGSEGYRCGRMRS